MTNEERRKISETFLDESNQVNIGIPINILEQGNTWSSAPRSKQQEANALIIYRRAIAAQPEIKELFTKSLFQAARETIIYRNAFPPYVEKDMEHHWAYENLTEFRKLVDETVDKLAAILAVKRITE